MQSEMQSKKKNRLKLKTGKAATLGAMGCALLLTLAGCGSSPKEEYAGAYDEINNAKTMEIDTKLALDVKGEGLDSETLSLLNSLEFNANIKSDTEKKLTEMNAGIKASSGPMNITMDLPMFLDENTGKTYTKADGFTEIMSAATMFMGFPMTIETPEAMQGKVIELAADAETELTEKEKAEQEEITQEITKGVMAALDDAPEDSFKKEDDVISYTADGEKVVDALFDVLEKNPELLSETGETVDAATISDMRASLKDSVTVGDVKSEATVKDGSIEKEVMDIPLTVKNADGQTLDITLTVTNVYKSIDEKIDFTFDVSEENVVTQEEYEAALDEAMMQNFEFSE